MKTATELLEAYLNDIGTPRNIAPLFADDGVLELPWINLHVQGPAEIEKMIAGLLARMPDFRFKNLTYFIQTPDKVAAEYQVETPVIETGKIYRQTYCGVLIAVDGKIKLLREALNTAAAAEAFSKD